MRKCKSCKSELPPVKKCPDIITTKGWCSPGCLAQWSADARKRTQKSAERKRVREARDRIKSRSEWLKEAQAAFNAYIRERDKHDPCISCLRHHAGQYHAGHYRSVGSCPELRFCEDNVHKQCQPCNTHLSGNLIEYRKALVQKIGADRLAWLEAQHDPARYTVEQIKAIRDEYKSKLKAMRDGEAE